MSLANLCWAASLLQQSSRFYPALARSTELFALPLLEGILLLVPRTVQVVQEDLGSSSPTWL